jgi:hypothetical protein
VLTVRKPASQGEGRCSFRSAARSPFGDEVRLRLTAAELAGIDLYDSQALQPMPDRWPMPAGFDTRGLFLVAGERRPSAACVPMGAVCFATCARDA